MDNKFLILQSIGINLFASVTSYASSRLYKKILPIIDGNDSSPLYGAITSFVFGVIITFLLMSSGFAKWQEDKIKKTVEKIEDSKII